MSDDRAHDGRRILLENAPAQTSRGVPSGITPPPPAPSGFLFKTVWQKNMFLCRKRKRFMSMVVSNSIQGGISCGLYYLFKNNMGGDSIGLVLMALICPMNLMFGISGSFQSAYMDIVGEKESKMKIVQNVYGLTSSMYWGTWAAYYSMLSLIGITILYILMMAVAPLLTHVNVLVSFAALAAAFVQQFIIVFIFTIFFDSWKTASTMSSFMNLGLMAAAAGLQAGLQGQAKPLFYLAGLIPTINVYSTFSSIFWMIGGFECNENGSCHNPGVTMSNLFADSVCKLPYYTPGFYPGPCENEAKFLSVGSSILMVLLDIVLFGLFALWLDNVWQGEYGVAKPLLFCFNPKYLCPKRQETLAPYADEAGTSANRHVAMSMRGLRKVFGPKVAVDDMTLDMFSGEIFALLGHNGAGKTTAINCIVGLIPMTSGEAMVNGFDVRTDIENARRQLSICPQDNPMYEEFTVRQHLRFFSSLRGVQEADVDARMGAVLRALGMESKTDDLCTSLSGGQKRRLWVATALVGQTPVAFLDEPTSGMDPSSRRELWDLLLEMKSVGRCVIFTTHYLEEADVLADRKAILARGKVQAVGTSRELKMQVGVGYHFSVELRPGASADSTGRLRNLVMRHVPTAKESHSSEEEKTQAVDAASNVRFTLPYSERASFGPMLLDIDAGKGALGVDDYSLAMTSLEEVFMTLGKQAEQQAGDGAVANVDFAEVDVDSGSACRSEMSEWKGITALAQVRVQAMFGNKRAAYAVCVAPIIFLLIAFFASPNSQAAQTNPDTFIFLPMSFGMTTIAFSMDIVRDRMLKMKHVAMSQGLSPKAYWLGTALGHLTLSTLVTSAVVILTIAVKPGGMQTTALPMVILMELIYPVNNLLFAYNAATVFKTPELAMKVLPLMNLFAGMIPSLLVWVFESPQLINSSLWTGVGTAIHIVMSLINPLYSLSGMFAYLLLSSSEELSLLGHLSSMAAVPLYCAPVTFFLLTGNLIRMDRRSYLSQPGDFTDFGDSKKDADVMDEERRCREELEAEDAARYSGLSHTYRTKVAGKWKETHAVRGISLGIRKGECFGLLGPNGAGKTTTLAVLTGEVRPPTRGKVAIFGNDLSTGEGLDAAYELLGVCPQIDPIWEDLTGFDHLVFYGRIKGVPEAELKSTVDVLLRRLGLEGEVAKRRAGSYSGGMKRKLSVGIALIGHSPMLFLDEPSAAVDAGAKRHLWKVIKRRGPDQTVVLTTHSMEEAEALCDRIAIQVQGQLRCIGSPAHIKRQYGAGYQLELFIEPSCQHSPAVDGLQRVSSGTFKEHAGTADSENMILGFVKEKVAMGAELLESHAARYLFQLPPVDRGGVSLGHIFSTVQEHMVSVGISDFSVTQPSLEQVFLRFAKEQQAESCEA